MSMSNAQRARVSFEAFLEQINNWELTLSREQKKLKTLRSHINSKIHLNELEIIITQIDTELIRYRKLVDPKKIQGIDVIQEYNSTSRRFMNLMESIGAFADKIDQNDQANTLELEHDLLPNSKTIGDLQAPRYHDQTFTYAISKQNKHISNDKQNNSSKNSVSLKNSFYKKNKSMGVQLQKGRKKDSQNMSSTFFGKDKKNGGGEDIDAWEIRYQLKEIKSMMSQIKNQIKFHNHEDVESELAKIQHNNKKMSLELKGLKEDNQYITTRMQKLKQELAGQKHIQAQMIQEFENPRKSRRSKVKGGSQTHNCSVNQEVSDWVKVRI